jgi:hypothetical protein
LLAFDAQLHGKGFSYGDGKTDRFYVDGWSGRDQYLSWDFRTVAAGSYNMSIVYRAGEGYGGTYQWQMDGSSGSSGSSGDGAVGTGDSVRTVNLGVVSLSAGMHELRLKPVDISARMLMRPLEVRLVRSPE